MQMNEGFQAFDHLAMRLVGAVFLTRQLSLGQVLRQVVQRQARGR